MAYNTYNPYQFYNPYIFATQPQQQTQNHTTQIQNGGFVIVKSIEEARNYPVAPGNSVTFKNENEPYVYTKTLGFSQLDQPIFEVYRLTKEEEPPNVEIIQTVEAAEDKPYFTLAEAEELKRDINFLKEEIDFLKEYIDEEKKEESKDESTEHTKPDESVQH